MAFANPFFSSAGQIERLKNVAGVLEASFNPFSKSKVTTTVKGAVGKVIETVANHPYIAAAAITTAAAPKAALAAAKVVGTKAIQTVSKLPTKTKVIGAIAAVPVTQVLITSKKARTGTVKAVSSIPTQLSDLGVNVGKFIEAPSLSNLKNIVTESPLVLAGAIAVGAVAAAPLVGSALSLREQKKQTKAFETQSKLMEKQLSQGGSAVQSVPVASMVESPSPILEDSTSPLAQQTKEIEKIGRKQVAKRHKKRKIYKEVPIRNTLKVLNVISNRAG